MCVFVAVFIMSRMRVCVSEISASVHKIQHTHTYTRTADTSRISTSTTKY